MTDQRATIAVPSPSPGTSLNLGKAWSGTSWNSAGLCVNTEGRVWLEAYGSASSSTMDIYSKGSGEDGQLLLQSLSSSLYMFAADAKSVNTATKSILIAGTDGVKLAAGHGGGKMNMPGFTYGSERLTAINDVTLVTDSGASTGNTFESSEMLSTTQADEFVELVERVADRWTYYEGVMQALSLGHQAVRMIVGTTGEASTLLGTIASGLTTAVKATTGQVDFGTVGKDNMPGLHLYSAGSVNLSSTGFMSMHSGISMLMTGFFVKAVGLIEAGVLAGKSAVFKAIWASRVEGSEISMHAGKDLVVASPKGELKLDGYEVLFEAKGSEAASQIPSAKVAIESKDEVNLSSAMNIKMKAGSNVNLTGDEIELVAGQMMQIKSPAYTLKISSTGGIEIVFQKTVKMSLGLDDVVIDMMKAMGMNVLDDSITIGANACGFDVSKDGTWVVTAPMVNTL